MIDLQEKHKKKVKKKRTKLGLLQCEHCEFKTSHEVTLINHIKKTHQEGLSYTCSLCGFETKWNRQYYKHMKTHFSGPPFRYLQWKDSIVNTHEWYFLSVFYVFLKCIFLKSNRIGSITNIHINKNHFSCLPFRYFPVNNWSL